MMAYLLLAPMRRTNLSPRAFVETASPLEQLPRSWPEIGSPESKIHGGICLPQIGRKFVAAPGIICAKTKIIPTTSSKIVCVLQRGNLSAQLGERKERS